MTKKVKYMVELIQADGWMLDRIRGSHRQFTHPTKPGTVTIAGKSSDDMYPKMILSILRQAGLTKADLR